jgi:hypothetical protein
MFGKIKKVCGYATLVEVTCLMFVVGIGGCQVQRRY